MISSLLSQYWKTKQGRNTQIAHCKGEQRNVTRYVKYTAVQKKKTCDRFAPESLEHIELQEMRDL